MTRATWAGALLLAAAALFLHREVILGGMVYHVEDAADGYYPSHVAAQRAIREGNLPTWERGSWSGWPLIVNPYYAFYYPLTALFYLFGPVKGLGVEIFLHVLLAAFGMFWLARRRGVPPEAALLAAASFAFSSFMTVRIRHIIFPQLLAWMPILLAATEGWLATGRRRELVLAACATAMALLSGGVPLLPYLAIVLAAYILPRIVAVAPPERSRKCAGLVLAGVIGALVAMAQLVPLAAHLPESARAVGTSYSFASTYAWPDVRYLATLVAPDLWGTETQWFGPYNHWEMAGYYAGLLPLLLAPLALARRGRAECWSLFAVAVLGAGLALGDAGPFHAWFFRHVPLYSTLRCPTRALVMALIAIPLLSADGLTWLGERAVGATRRRGTLVAGVALAVAAALIAWQLTRLPFGSGPQEMQMARALLHVTGVLGTGALVVSLLAGGWMARRPGAFAVAAITLIELLVVSRAAVQPRPADWVEGTERFAAVDWLIARRPAERFIGEASGPFRLHNLGMTYGLEGAGGYDSLAIWRYVGFLWAVNAGGAYPHDTLEDDLALGSITRFDTPWVDFLNLRWAITSSAPATHWIERYRLPPAEPPHARYETAWDRALRVYENPRVLPRAFVVYRAEVIPGDQAQAAALNRIDPRQVVMLDRTPPVHPAGVERPLTPARMVHATRHAFAVDVETDAPGILVMSEPWYPGWTATVNGRPAPLLRANYAFRGVALERGRHIVELRFRSRPAEWGMALSALGIASLLALAFVRI